MKKFSWRGLSIVIFICVTAFLSGSFGNTEPTGLVGKEQAETWS